MRLACERLDMGHVPGPAARALHLVAGLKEMGRHQSSTSASVCQSGGKAGRAA